MKKKVLALLIPGTCLLFGCANNAATTAMLYAPSPIEKASTISSSNKTIFNNFVNLVAPNFFAEFGKSGDSTCLSLPDLFLCYNMMAMLSESSVQEAYLAELGASSMDELASTSKELIPVFCYVENDGESDSGAFNLNGLFFSPDLELKDNADNAFKTIAEAFNGYVFKSKPTTEVVDDWIREADEEGYLSEVPTPDLDEDTIFPPLVATLFSMPLGKNIAKPSNGIYKEGSRRLEYTLADGNKKEVDYLSFSRERASIEKGSNYVAASGSIDSCSITAYYPDEGVGLADLSESIFSSTEKTYERYDTVYLHLPMFDVDSSLNGHPSSLVPSFKEGVGTGFFEKKEGAEYDSYLCQNNKLTLDYKGFKGASITLIGVTESTAQPSEEPTQYTLEVDRPFIFKVSRDGLPLYYGQINDPGYSLYQ